MYENTMKWNIIKIVGIFLLTTFCLNTVEANHVLLNEWNAFKLQFGKQYNNILDYGRFLIFQANYIIIKEHNAKYSRGEVSFAMEINNFTDLTNEEFESSYLGNDAPSLLDNHNEISNTNQLLFESTTDNISDAIDWRQKGAVTGVKSQGHCGSCWAFSAIGALEGQWFLKTKKLVSLSEQNLLDCSGEYANHGCGGGTSKRAFRYIQENKGIDTEISYPYEHVQKACRFNSTNIGATVNGFYQLRRGNEIILKNAIATIGPISVAIKVGQSFHRYSNGIYDDSTCDTITRLSHAVTLVGYGTENGKDYWLVKNSWGERWGDHGYIKMVRNKNNQCGIASYAVVPVI